MFFLPKNLHSHPSANLHGTSDEISPHPDPFLVLPCLLTRPVRWPSLGPSSSRIDYSPSHSTNLPAYLSGLWASPGQELYQQDLHLETEAGGDHHTWYIAATQKYSSIFKHNLEPSDSNILNVFCKLALEIFATHTHTHTNSIMKQIAN